MLILATKTKQKWCAHGAHIICNAAFVIRLTHFQRFRYVDFTSVQNPAKMSPLRIVEPAWSSLVSPRSFCFTSNVISTLFRSTFQKCSKTLENDTFGAPDGSNILLHSKCISARWCPLAAFVLRLTLFQQFQDLAFKSVPTP